MLLDILKNQELRKLVILGRNSILKEKKNFYTFRHNKGIYTVTPFRDFFDQTKPIGFNLIISSESDQEIHNFVNEPWEQDMSKMIIRFKNDENIEKRVIKSLKFLKQIFGVSGQKVKEVIEGLKEEEINIHGNETVK